NVYKDILADVKREHDECITAIKNGQKETSYLQNKIKTLSNISTTIAGYSRRKRDLEEKLEILQEDNKRLEDELEDLLKSDEEDEVEEEPRLVESPQEKEDRRPIPGISVEDWTNEKLLQELVIKLDTAIEDVFNKQKCLYVPISRKYEVDTLLQDRIEARDELLAEGKLLRRGNAVYKIALDAVNDFNSSDEIIDEDLGEYLIRVLQNENYLERRSSSVTSLTGQSIHEDDDPTKEKEAETILEYIDKFNELFADGLFNQAAVHAANSPRGVLRSIETMDRFKEVSNNYQGTPTPLLMYAEALMHASNAQDHVADAEMSTVLSRFNLLKKRYINIDACTYNCHHVFVLRL
uniref:Translin-associated factor X-interacting protein 1 N-terminal domain-containing protein n=1 Tax=Ciona intestinalis TaxID=7719 RepID=F6QV69_CIOIN